MKVSLNKDSWHFKYYTHCIGGNPPRTLCPYFWIMVSLILASPFIGLANLISYVVKTLVTLRYKMSPIKKQTPKPQKTYEELIKELEKQNELHDRRRERWSKVGDFMSIISKWVMLPLLIVGLVISIYLAGDTMGWMSFLIRIGISILLIGVFITLIHYSIKYERELGRGFNKVFRIINPLNWKLIQIIGEMIVAGYTKACPLVDWVGEDKNENSVQEININQK